jgi:hypothetical protein
MSDEFPPPLPIGSDQPPSPWAKPGGTGGPMGDTEAALSSPTPQFPPVARAATGDSTPGGLASSTPLESYVAPSTRKGRRGKMLASLVAVAALGGGTVFAISQASGGDDGGAASPQAALEKLLESAGTSDLLGVMDAIEPAERDSFKDPMIRANAELQRLGILDEGLNLNAVPGLTMTFSDMKYATTEVGDGVSTVEITGGRVHTVGDWDKAPLGDFLVNELLDGERPTGIVDETDEVTTDDDPALVTTVQRNGRWFVSLWYSLAEQARLDAGLDAPQFGKGVAAKGADSPEAAVREMIEAGTRLDLRRAIELLPPGEMAVLHDYAPLFLTDAESAVADFKSENPFTVAIEKLDLTSTGSGNNRLVRVGSLKGTATIGEVKASLEMTDGCYTTILEGPDFEGGQSTQKGCTRDGLDQLKSLGLGGFTDSFTRMDGLGGIAVVNEGGEWFVSPTASMTDNLILMLKQLTQQDLRDFKQWMEDLRNGEIDPAEGGILTGGGPLGGLLGGIGGSSSGFDETTQAAPADASVTSETSAIPDSPSARALQGCFETSGSEAEVSTCLTEAIAAGTIDANEVPTQYRYPQCYGTFFSDAATMSDAAFKVAVTKVASCLTPFVTSGELSAEAVDPMLLHAECVKSNLYTQTGTDDSADAYETFYVIVVPVS